MGNSLRDEKPDVTARCYTHAFRRLQHRRLKLARALAGQIPNTGIKSCNIEDVAFDVATEVCDADLRLLLDEHPDWLLRPSTELHASDLFAGVSIRELIVRYLTNLLIEWLQSCDRSVNE